jgi:hypothetical protein
MTAAIYYHPEAYTTSGPTLMGRNAAGESFLRGFLAYSRTDEFWAQVEQPEHARHFTATVRAAGRSEPVKAVTRHSLASLSQAGVVYYPGPGLGQHAWRRAACGHGAWSLCGITHTTASARVMDAIADLLTAPVQPWDAVICTSTAVKDNVQRVLQAQAYYLAQHLGAQRLALPRLPVIPLGIHSRDFALTQEQKAQARQTLGADHRTPVVLFTGRLSFHAKAHPLAMYQQAMDPFYAFARYPTRALTAQTVLQLVDADLAAALRRLAQYRKLAMVDFAKIVLPGEVEVHAVLAAVAAGPRPATELIEAIPSERQAVVLRALAWLVKLGILQAQ